jgi:oligopeptide/dipeptide ABC transporter ATP-binding protein
LAFDQKAVEMNATKPLLEVEDLVKHFAMARSSLFGKKAGFVRAVDGISLEVHPGETLGLVGESGCGKSTVARTLLRLEKATSGQAYFDGRDIFGMSRMELRKWRRRVQMIFQDPYGSLDPRWSVGNIISEPWTVHPGIYPLEEHRERARDLMGEVGLDPHHDDRYPHQFSGGQRQRVGIARALAVRPDLLVCDEPVSALDVSVQSQVISLLKKIQDEVGVAFVFISHDLALVRHISDRVAVMYMGQIVEIGNEDDIYERSTHPYTQALLSAVPVPDPKSRGKRKRIFLEGEVPSPINPPSGCRFRTRCWKAQEKCALEIPKLLDCLSHGHPSACHYPELG